jgi:hypothetical protein
MLNRSLSSLALLFVIIGTLSFACNRGENRTTHTRLPRDKQLLARQSLLSLRKLQLSVELRESVDKMRERLVDTRAEVESTLAQLPESDVKKEITLALNSFTDRNVLIDKVEESGALYKAPPDVLVLDNQDKVDTILVDRLTKQYGLSPVDEKEQLLSFRTDQVMNTISQQGRSHIERGFALLGK